MVILGRRCSTARCQLLNDIQGWVTPSRCFSPHSDWVPPPVSYLVPPREPTLRNPWQRHTTGPEPSSTKCRRPQAVEERGEQGGSEPAGQRNQHLFPDHTAFSVCSQDHLCLAWLSESKTPNVRRKTSEKKQWPNCATEIGSFTGTRKGMKRRS